MQILCVVIGLTALETLVNLIMEIYRVRVKGAESRLLYESRLVGLLGKPEAILTTAAHALDYQFGFKISETELYRFLEKKLPVLVLAQAGVLLLSSCFVLIEPGQQALLERMSAPVGDGQVLNPGLHIKLPWPIDKVYSYRTEQIQSFTVGTDSDEDEDANGEEHGHEGSTIVWTHAHAAKEDSLLVAGTPGTNSLDRSTPPVNLISIGVPVQFQITNLPNWAYVNNEPGQLLRKLALREVVRYLASADLSELMAHKRAEAGETLKERIQNAANQRKLGVTILFAGVEDIHPPITVAASYEEVIGAAQDKAAQITSAQSAAAQTKTTARYEAHKRVVEAETARILATNTAAANANYFEKQILAYNAAPSVYSARTYIPALANAAAPVRKFIIAATNTSSDVIQINLEEKILDMTAAPVTTTPQKN